MPLFEVAITEKKKNREILLLSPTPVLAKDCDSAIAIATIIYGKAIKINNPNNIEVIVRPF